MAAPASGRRPTTRPGPRGDGADTRALILDAARTSFAERGYTGTTLRAVAAAAGVDVALVPYYFGSKEQLFTAAMDVPVHPEELIERAFADGPEHAGPRLVELFLGLWESPESGPAVATMFRSATTHEDSRRALAEFANTEIIGSYARHLGGPDARRRATLVASQLVGMAALRHLIRVEPATALSRKEVVALLGPTIQQYLTGELPQAAQEDGRSPRR